tara:strand:- start:2298 stop:2894 length:597 start_codon:yes stop_codon:yes gene_type:complete
MSTEIQDGAGTGNRATVDGKNRLHVGSVVRTERNAAIDRGEAFLFGSTVITFTDDVSTPMVYIKNTSTRDLVISNIFNSIGSTTGGTGDAYFTVWKNADATSGIVTTATSCPVSNMNIGSSIEFEGSAFIGATGETFTGAGGIHTTIIQEKTIVDVDIPLVIAKGQNVLFSIQPPTGNTSFSVMLAITVYYLDNDLTN